MKNRICSRLILSCRSSGRKRPCQLMGPIQRLQNAFRTSHTITPAVSAYIYVPQILCSGQKGAGEMELTVREVVCLGMCERREKCGKRNCLALFPVLA